MFLSSETLYMSPNMDNTAVPNVTDKLFYFKTKEIQIFSP